MIINDWTHGSVIFFTLITRERQEKESSRRLLWLQTGFANELRDWSFVFLLVHAKQRRTSLKRDDEHEAAAAMFCLLCCTLFVWCVCVCVCVPVCFGYEDECNSSKCDKPISTQQQRQRLQKRENWRRGPGSNKRTDERRRASADAAPAAERLSYERTRGRSRARAPLRRLCPPTNEQMRGRAQSPLLRWFCPAVSDVSHVESVGRLPSVSHSENPSSCLTAVCFLGRSCVYCWVELHVQWAVYKRLPTNLSESECPNHKSEATELTCALFIGPKDTPLTTLPSPPPSFPKGERETKNRRDKEERRESIKH